MRRVNTFFLLRLGQRLAPLLGRELPTEGVPYGVVFRELDFARDEVRFLLNENVLVVRICRTAASELLSKIDAVVPNDFAEAVKKDQSEKVPWYSLWQIRTAAEKFRTVLAEELNVLDTYSVSQKAAYSTAYLIESADAAFPESIRSKLPKKAIDDIRQAGRCLAFETPTAAAFHMVRAIESLILAYYSKVSMKTALPKMRNWAVYINAIKRFSSCDPKIVGFLEHIRDSYRNPISHPDAVLSMEEALVLFSVTVGAITQIALAL